MVADNYVGPGHEESVLQTSGVTELWQTLDGPTDIVRQNQTHQQTGQSGTGNHVYV